MFSITLKTIQEKKFSHEAYILYIRVDSSAVIYILSFVKISTVLSLLSKLIIMVPNNGLFDE